MDHAIEQGVGLQQVPHVNRQEFTLLDITEDGFVSAPLYCCSSHSCMQGQPLLVCKLCELRSSPCARECAEVASGLFMRSCP